MFSFLKKLRPEPEEELTIRERALRVFSRIDGLDDIKEMMLRALQSHERAHTLLTGPPASAKSLFMLQIEKFMSSKVYFAEGASTTKAELQKFIAENQHKEIIIIDELDKMAMKDQQGLLTMMERGEFTSTKVRNTERVKANVVIFATSNSTERLSKPLLSRFTVFEIPEYTYPEFEAISTRIVNRLPQNSNTDSIVSLEIGQQDRRDVLKIAKLCICQIPRKT